MRILNPSGGVRIKSRQYKSVSMYAQTTVDTALAEVDPDKTIVRCMGWRTSENPASNTACVFMWGSLLDANTLRVERASANYTGTVYAGFEIIEFESCKQVITKEEVGKGLNFFDEVGDLSLDQYVAVGSGLYGGGTTNSNKRAESYSAIHKVDRWNVAFEHYTFVGGTSIRGQCAILK